MQHPLLRLSAADFDAFLERGGHTRARMELKNRAIAWARGVVERLGELGTPVEASVVLAPAHGGMRVFFWRDARARADVERLIDHKKTLAAALAGPATDHKHAHLGLAIDASRVEVSFEVHPDAWVDARNLRARLGEPEGVLELTSALETLPEEFAIGLASGMLRRPALEARAEQIRELVARSVQDATPFWVGWTVPRGVAVRHSAALDELLEGAIVALGPVYKLVAWAPDNDLLVVGREWEARAHARDSRAPEDDRERRPKHWPKKRRFEREREPRSMKPSAPPAPAPRLSTSARDRPKIPHATRPAFRTLPRRSPVMDVDPHAPIEKGARVRVLSGPFVGRIGTVQALDGRGFAKVLLGLLATRVAIADLIATAEGHGTRALATSHRKPT